MENLLKLIQENPFIFVLTLSATVMVLVFKYNDRKSKTTTIVSKPQPNTTKDLMRSEAMDELMAYIKSTFEDAVVSHDDFAKTVTDIRKFWLPVLDRLDKKE